MKESTESDSLRRMAALCSVKEYCIRDIRQKIMLAGLTEEACGRIVDRLCAEKFIDEERYVNAYIRDKLQFAKWGRIKIRYELLGKGIPSGIVEQALDTINEPDYIATLKAILMQKQKQTKGKTPGEVYQKLFRFAAGRGFESREITPCLKEILGTNKDEDLFE